MYRSELAAARAGLYRLPFFGVLCALQAAAEPATQSWYCCKWDKDWFDFAFGTCSEKSKILGEKSCDGEGEFWAPIKATDSRDAATLFSARCRVRRWHWWGTRGKLCVPKEIGYSDPCCYDDNAAGCETNDAKQDEATSCPCIKTLDKSGKDVLSSCTAA